MQPPIDCCQCAARFAALHEAQSLIAIQIARRITQIRDSIFFE
jgi:hypothetical protein